MLDRLKKLFVVEDNDPLKKALEKKSELEAQSQSTAVPPPMEKPTESPRFEEHSSTPRSPVQGGKITEKFMDILMEAMDRQNVEGMDYLEFKQSLQSMKNIEMDEATRYKSAFAMAQTMGATPAKLKSSAQHYLNVLQQEEHKFAKALRSQKEKQIGGRQERLTLLNKKIREKQRQIQQLQQEIEVHRKESDQIHEQISNSSVKVEHTKNNFMVTYQLLVSQIKNDIQKMNDYLH